MDQPPLFLFTNYCHPNGHLTNTGKAEKENKFGEILENSHLYTTSHQPLPCTDRQNPSAWWDLSLHSPAHGKGQEQQGAAHLPYQQGHQGLSTQPPTRTPVQGNGFWKPVTLSKPCRRPARPTAPEPLRGHSCGLFPWPPLQVGEGLVVSLHDSVL